MDAVWGSLMEEVAALRGPVPVWKKGDKSEEAKKAEWIYRSGLHQGVTSVLELFEYERQSQDR